MNKATRSGGRSTRRVRRLAILGAPVLAFALAVVFATQGNAAPSSFVALNGAIRWDGTNGTYDWANGGSSPGACTLISQTIHCPGTHGLFDGGKFVNSTTTPTAPSFLATGDSSIVSHDFVVDPLGSDSTTCSNSGKGDPTVFTGAGGETNNEDFNTMTYGTGSVPTKDEITNAYAIAHSTGSGNEVFIGAERVVNNGDSHLDFEFTQAAVTTPTACSGTMVGHRTEGDLIITADFTTGGSFAGLRVFQWHCLADLTPPLTQPADGTLCDPAPTGPDGPSAGDPNYSPHYSQNTSAAAKAAVKSAVNSVTVDCGGWACRTSAGAYTATVPTNEFFEAGINLGELGFTGCVSTFIPHTRSSQEITASLKDFGGPVAFNSCKSSTVTSPSASTIELGKSITDTATVTGTNGGNPGPRPTGTVSFSVCGPFSSPTNCTANDPTNKTISTNALGTSCQGLLSNQACATSDSFTPTTTGTYCFLGVFNPDANYPSSSDGSSTRECFKVVDAGISLSPLSKTNEAGKDHTVTCTIKVDNGDGSGLVNAPDGTTCSLSLTNSNGATAKWTTGPGNGTTSTSCTTTGGSCTATLNSPTAGKVTIHGTTTVTVGGLSLTRSTGDTNVNDGSDVTKTYVDAGISLSPLTKTNEAGKDHTVTCTIKVNTGDGNGLVNAPDGTTCSLSLTNSNGATAKWTTGPGSGTTSTSCTTSGGSCTATLNSPTAGTVTIHATTTVTVGGVSLTRATGDSNVNDGSDASKTYVDAGISLSPLTKTNEVGKDHVVTCAITADYGDGNGQVPAPDGTECDLSLTNSNGANATWTTGPGAGTTSTSCLTSGGTGKCQATLNSSKAGKVTIHATTTFSVGGVSLTRSTGDSNVNDGPDVTKLYVDAGISLSPLTATNAVGQDHKVTCTIVVDSGDGKGLVAAPDGTKCDLSLTNDATATATWTTGPGAGTTDTSCLTSGGTGTCDATLNSPTGGTVTIHATTTLTVGGLSLTRSTGDSNVNDGPDVTKTYVNAGISLSPLKKFNEVGQDHKVTCSIVVDNGDGKGLVAAPDGTECDLSLTNSNGATATWTTGPGAGTTSTSCLTTGGSCDATLNSPTAGTVTIHATATLTVGGVTFTIATGDSNANDGPDVTKIYEDLAIKIAPNGTNLIYDNHKFTVTVLQDLGDGKGFVPLQGVKPAVSFTDAGGATSSVVTDNCASTGTDANGQCTVTITSPTTGTTTAHAKVTATLNGVSITRETDGKGSNSGDATKTWVSAQLKLTKTFDQGVLTPRGKACFTLVRDSYGGTGADPGSYLSTDPAEQCDDTGTLTVTITWHDLVPGTYHVTESLTPAGYSKMADITGITIADDPNTLSYEVKANDPPEHGSFKIKKTISGSTNLGPTNSFQFKVQPCGADSTCASPGTQITGSPFTVDNTHNPITIPDPTTCPDPTQSCGLTEGYYLVTELPNPDYTPDVNPQIVEVLAGNQGGVVTVTFNNTPSRVGQITPTNTTCSDFTGGTASTLANLTYQTSGGKINNVQPGVFFYFVKIKAPAASFTADVSQAITTGSLTGPTPFFTMASGSAAFNADCTKNGATLSTPSAGDVKFTFTGATPGATYILSVKYSAKSIQGDTPTPNVLNAVNVVDTFQTSITNGGPPVTVTGSDQGLGLKRTG